MSEQETDPIAEIDAMKSVAEALAPLNEDSCGRVLRWAADRFSVSIDMLSKGNSSTETEEGAEVDEAQENSGIGQSQFDDIADLYSTVTPKYDPEKALVIGYWFQVIQGQSDFDSQRINKELKNLGHGVTNITSAMTSLIGRKPALVMQTKKSGNSQQSRKKYKLTHEGIKMVKEMIAN